MIASYIRGLTKCRRPAAMKPMPRRARDIRTEGTNAPRPFYFFSVMVSTLEPAPWRPESPAQRATNSAGPLMLNVAVKRPPLAPAVTTCSRHEVEPTLRAETTIGSPPCAPFSAPPTVIRLTFFVTFLVLVVSESVEAPPASPPLPVVKRLRNTSLPAAGVDVSAYARVADGLITPSVPGNWPLAIRCGRQCL